ncbi:hypothetical protein BMW24_001100 [Mycobacterium heckeshornense]|nr:hypothetical protein BMW24_001100 [Mycobacterium heckeshornense]
MALSQWNTDATTATQPISDRRAKRDKHCPTDDEADHRQPFEIQIRPVELRGDVVLPRPGSRWRYELAADHAEAEEKHDSPAGDDAQSRT